MDLRTKNRSHVSYSEPPQDSWIHAVNREEARNSNSPAMRSVDRVSNIHTHGTVTTRVMLALGLIAVFLFTGTFKAKAQDEPDRFNVGPYIVEYGKDGDVKYRLKDNVDLYEFFELRQDTTIISIAEEIPLKKAIQISGRVGANRFASKEIGLDGVWKQSIGKNLYFNGGVSFAFGLTNFGDRGVKRNMFEVGIPLQIELGKLNHQHASFYGLFGLMPTFYSTMSASYWDPTASKAVNVNNAQASTPVVMTDNTDGTNDKKDDGRVDGLKKSGFLIAPSLEFGGNIPVGNAIMRIGVYATYKINCTTSEYDVYKQAGKMFLGAKIGVAF